MPARKGERKPQQKPERIRRVLLVLAMYGGNASAASKALRQEGIRINRHTLTQWSRETYVDYYQEAIQLALGDDKDGLKVIWNTYMARMLAGAQHADARTCASVLELVSKLQALANGTPTENVSERLEIVYRTYDKDKDAKAKPPQA